MHKGDSDYLQRLQNMGLRTILHRDSRTAIADLHQEANIEDLADRRKQHVCQYVCKGLHKLSTPVVNSMFKERQDVSERTTRAVVRGDLEVPKCSLEIGKRSISYRGPSYYNKLDPVVRNSPTLDLFKRAMKDPG